MKGKFPEVPVEDWILGLGCWKGQALTPWIPGEVDEDPFEVRFEAESAYLERWNPSSPDKDTFPILSSLLGYWNECKDRRISATAIEKEMKKHCKVRRGDGPQIVKLITKGYFACRDGISLKPRQAWEFASACIASVNPCGKFDEKTSWKRGGVGTEVMRAVENQKAHIKEYLKEYGAPCRLFPKETMDELSLTIQRHARYVICRLVERWPLENEGRAEEREVVLNAILGEHFPGYNNPVEWELPLLQKVLSHR